MVLAFVVLLAGCSGHPVKQETVDQSHVYSTWPDMEMDKLASAWLIKRFVDHDAVFEFFPKGELITRGTGFDTPDSEFRHNGNYSTYETLSLKYHLNDPALVKIGQMVHQVEIEVWREQTGETMRLNQQLTEIMQKTEDNNEIFQKSFLIMDEQYKKQAMSPQNSPVNTSP